MEQLQRAFEPYRHLDPLGWIGFFRVLPVWAGLLAIVFGGLMLFFGRGRLFRIVAVPLGAAIGLIWFAAIAQRFGLTAPASQVTLGAAIVMALLGLAFPPGVVFFAFGMPIGLLAAQLVGPTDWLLAFMPGLIIGGAVGVVLHPIVSSLLSAVIGAWSMVIGFLAMLGPFVNAVDGVAQNPLVIFSVVGCFTIAGAGYQLMVRGSDEDVDKSKREQHMLKKKLKEDRELKKRWANYTKNSKKRG